MDTLAETDPFSPFHPNCCCICQATVRGCANGVPKYLCAECWKTWGAAFVERQPWIYALYRQEHARRKRRTRRAKAQTPFINSLDALLEVHHKGALELMG
jgi:hypothetical protein